MPPALANWSRTAMMTIPPITSTMEAGAYRLFRSNRTTTMAAKPSSHHVLTLLTPSMASGSSVPKSPSDPASSRRWKRKPFTQVTAPWPANADGTHMRPRTTGP